jgi:signal transduction histidine kinase
VNAWAPRRQSLVRRLVALAAAWSLAVLIAAALVLVALFGAAATERFDNGLSDVVDGLVAGTSVDENGEVAAPAVTDPRALRAYSGDYWQIATASGAEGLHPVARSRSLWDTALPPPAAAGLLAASRGRTQYYDSPGPARQPLRIAVLQARLPGAPGPLYFMAAEDRTPVDTDIRNFTATLAIALVLLGAGLMAAVFIQVRLGLQPLFALSREVAAVRTGKADRVAGDYPIELAPLAEELNALVAHNQDVVERQRTHVGNLAHALKTPLSVMLTEAAQRPGDLADVVTRQARTMRQQVDHHLRRARAAARTQGRGERCELAPVLDELSRTLEKIHGDRRVAVDWDCPDGLYFLGERQDLLEMAGNTMDNACKWCARRVRVTAAATGPDRLTLTIADDGPGLPPEKYDEVLRRGARLDESAPGSGLGLAIVDELARAYGGQLTLAPSPLGGLQVDLILPAAAG